MYLIRYRNLFILFKWYTCVNYNWTHYKVFMEWFCTEKSYVRNTQFSMCYLDKSSTIFICVLMEKFLFRQSNYRNISARTIFRSFEYATHGRHASKTKIMRIFRIVYELFIWSPKKLSPLIFLCFIWRAYWWNQNRQQH